VIKKKLALSFAIFCVGVSSCYAAQRDNPFEKPVIKIDKEGEKDSVDKNVINEVIGGSIGPDSSRRLEDSKFIRQGYKYKGSMNGVDIYYHPELKRYERDDSKLMKINNLNTNLPPMNKVNY
jgi:hypothetical protein